MARAAATAAGASRRADALDTPRPLSLSLSLSLPSRLSLWTHSRDAAALQTATRAGDKAAQALANLAARDELNKAAITAAHAVPALVALLESQLDAEYRHVPPIPKTRSSFFLS